MKRLRPGYAPAPPTDPAMCYPSRPALECNLCRRHRRGAEIPTSLRHFVVIDASSLPRGTTGCAMFVPVPVARPFAEVESKELETA